MPGTRRGWGSRHPSLNVALEEKESEFLEVFQAAIAMSYLTAWSRSSVSHSYPQEPDYVAALVLEGTPLFQRGLDALLPAGVSSQVLGVYCHQSPYVQFDDAPDQQCELGDMLVCHFHEPAVGMPRQNALLLQAKIRRREPMRLSGDDLTQLELYSGWPSFSYISRPLTGQRRQVVPSSPHAGAQYLTIQTGLVDWRHSSMQIAFPWNPLISREPLEEEFFRLLWGNTGRAFLPPTLAAKDGWSQVVWDLITSAARKTFRREKTGITSAPRLADPKGLDGLWICRGYSSVREAIQSLVVGWENEDGAGGPDIIPPETVGPLVDEDSAPSLLVVRTQEVSE